MEKHQKTRNTPKFRRESMLPPPQKRIFPRPKTEVLILKKSVKTKKHHRLVSIVSPTGKGSLQPQTAAVRVIAVKAHAEELSSVGNKTGF